jgi:hypothetical protein
MISMSNPERSERIQAAPGEAAIVTFASALSAG